MKTRAICKNCQYVKRLTELNKNLHECTCVDSDEYGELVSITESCSEFKEVERNDQRRNPAESD